jgi:hypothetical protein
LEFFEILPANMIFELYVSPIISLVLDAPSQQPFGPEAHLDLAAWTRP